MNLIILWISISIIICAGAWRIDRAVARRRNGWGFPATRRVYRHGRK